MKILLRILITQSKKFNQFYTLCESLSLWSLVNLASQIDGYSDKSAQFCPFKAPRAFSYYSESKNYATHLSNVILIERPGSASITHSQLRESL